MVEADVDRVLVVVTVVDRNARHLLTQHVDVVLVAGLTERLPLQLVAALKVVSHHLAGQDRRHGVEQLLGIVGGDQGVGRQVRYEPAHQFRQGFFALELGRGLAQHGLENALHPLGIRHPHLPLGPLRLRRAVVGAVAAIAGLGMQLGQTPAPQQIGPGVVQLLHQRVGQVGLEFLGRVVVDDTL